MQYHSYHHSYCKLAALFLLAPSGSYDSSGFIFHQTLFWFRSCLLDLRKKANLFPYKILLKITLYICLVPNPTKSKAMLKYLSYINELFFFLVETFVENVSLKSFLESKWELI